MLKNAGIALLPLIEGVRSMGLRYLADTRRLADGIRAAPSGLFLRELLESPAVVGAVWPSSARLARAMAASVDPRSDGQVAVLGAGTSVGSRGVL